MSEKSLEEKIRDWLNKGGFPLEMRIADAFSKNHFRVIQSEYYTDVNTGAPREIDVYASIQENVEDTFARLAAVIECKSDTTKPWVVFTSNRVQLASPASVVQRSASMLGDRWLHSIAHRTDVSGLRVFRLPSRPGYGVTAA